MNLTPKTWSEVMAQRSKGTINEHWQSTNPQATQKIFMAPCDLGVRLNGGRPGARFAPQAISAVLKKMKAPDHWSENSLFAEHYHPSSPDLPLEKRQAEQAKFLAKFIETQSSSGLIHLGGGHDHILPLMRALNSEQGLCVLNLDAHLDTRVDPFSHSGTPFRDFAEETKRPFHLIQVGIHPYTNPKENYHPLAHGQMDIWPGLQREKLISWIDAVHSQGPCPEAPILLSLDADGLCASIMEAVSAVNHNGLSLEEVRGALEWSKQQDAGCRAFGLYEYNPVYDNLSQKGAKALAGLIYEFWKKN